MSWIKECFQNNRLAFWTVDILNEALLEKAIYDKDPPEPIIKIIASDPKGACGFLYSK